MNCPGFPESKGLNKRAGNSKEGHLLNFDCAFLLPSPIIVEIEGRSNLRGGLECVEQRASARVGRCLETTVRLTTTERVDTGMSAPELNLLRTPQKMRFWRPRLPGRP